LLSFGSFTKKSIPIIRRDVPGVEIKAIGARRMYGAKMSRRMPIITEPKQKTNQETVATNAKIQSANPAIKAQMP
jgi:hypothetical protein